MGQLTLIDLDHVAESNINRQIHAETATLGMAKIEAMRQRIARIHPDCNVRTIDAFVEPDNWPALLPDGVQAVIDACDQIRAKTAMADWARGSRAVFVSVGAAGGKRLAHKVDIADLSETTPTLLATATALPLAQTPRCAKNGKRIGVNCVFSREAVAPADASCGVAQGTTPQLPRLWVGGGGNGHLGCARRVGSWMKLVRVESSPHEKTL